MPVPLLTAVEDKVDDPEVPQIVAGDAEAVLANAPVQAGGVNSSAPISVALESQSMSSVTETVTAPLFKGRLVPLPATKCKSDADVNTGKNVRVVPLPSRPVSVVHAVNVVSFVPDPWLKLPTLLKAAEVPFVKKSLWSERSPE